MYRVHKRQKGAGEREFPSIWDSSEAWAACAKALREYDEDMIQDWKEDIDTLLVFAGLFSAVVTAFNIESYQLLQQQPEDSVTAILTQISSQLNSFTMNANFVNTTHPALDASSPPTLVPSAFAVRLNTLWFSSLVCSLLSASLGLLVKQWLREYLAGSSNISRESIRIRQYRYEGLRKWHVPEIILCLPILLQAALLFFFIGLLDLLWTLHPVVAAIVTTIVAVSMFFAMMTSLLPPLYADCPYKSPQSWLICIFTQSVKRSLAVLASHYYAQLYHSDTTNTTNLNRGGPGTATPDPFASRLDLPSIVHSKLSTILVTWLHCLSLVRPYSSWKERERLHTEAATGPLDDATLAGADATFMDDAFLHAVVRPCMRDIAPHAALRCVDRILLRRAPRVLNGMPYWELAHALDAGRGNTGTLTLMHLLLDVLHRLNADWQFDVGTGEGGDGEDERDAKDDARRRVLMTMHRLVRAIPAPSKPSSSEALVSGSGSGGDAQTRALFRRMFEVLAGVLDTEVNRASPERFVRERSFNLMLKLFPRFHAVGPTCISAFCAYSKQTRVENAPYRFVQACYMVIRASAALASGSPSLGANEDQVQHSILQPSYTAAPEPESSSGSLDASLASSVTLCAEPLSVRPSLGTTVDDVHAPDAADEYASVRPAVLRVLHDLEGFLAAPVARAAEYHPTAAMLAECAQAVLALASHDRGAVSRGLVRALSELVGGVGVVEPWAVEGFWVESGSDGRGRERETERGRTKEDHDGDTARMAVRVLRRMYRMRDTAR